MSLISTAALGMLIWIYMYKHTHTNIYILVRLLGFTYFEPCSYSREANIFMVENVNLYSIKRKRTECMIITSTLYPVQGQK